MGQSIIRDEMDTILCEHCDREATYLRWKEEVTYEAPIGLADHNYGDAIREQRRTLAADRAVNLVYLCSYHQTEKD